MKLGDIDTRRQELIARTLGLVYNVLDSLSTGTTACAEFHCDSLLLGEFVKILKRNGLLWPRAAKPFAGVNYAAVVKSVGPLLQYRRRGYEQGDNSCGSQVPQVANGAGNRPNGVRRVSGTHGTKGVNGVNGTQSSPNKREKVVRLNGSHGEPLPAAESPTGDEFGVHECDSTRLVAGLGRLNKLAEAVAGLEMETSLGDRGC